MSVETEAREKAAQAIEAAAKILDKPEEWIALAVYALENVGPTMIEAGLGFPHHDAVMDVQRFERRVLDLLEAPE